MREVNQKIYAAAGNGGQTMDRWMNAKEVGRILGYKDPDAVRRIMRSMVHMEEPLRVSESALEGWIAQRTFRPGGEKFDKAPDAAEGRFPRRRNGKLAV